MLATLKLLKIIHPDGPHTPDEKRSLKFKEFFFVLAIVSTIGLIIFFLKHRFLCHDLGNFNIIGQKEKKIVNLAT